MISLIMKWVFFVWAAYKVGRIVNRGWQKFLKWRQYQKSKNYLVTYYAAAIKYGREDARDLDC